MPPSEVSRSSISTTRPSDSSLLVPLARLIHPLQPLGDPRLLAARGLGIITARDANADGVLEARTVLEQVRAALVDFRVFLVPEDVAAVGIKEHDALRQDVDRLAQTLVDLRASAIAASAWARWRTSSPISAAARRRTAGEFRHRFGPAIPDTGCFGQLLLLGFPGRIIGIARPTRIPARRHLCDKCLKNWYLLPE